MRAPEHRGHPPSAHTVCTNVNMQTPPPGSQKIHIFCPYQRCTTLPSSNNITVRVVQAAVPAQFDIAAVQTHLLNIADNGTLRHLSDRLDVANR